MRVNNNSPKTDQPNQPLNNQESLQKATREEIIKIFNIKEKDDKITKEEQEIVIRGYLYEECQKYDESIIEQSMKTWIYKDIYINDERDQPRIDALKGKINVIKDQIARNSSKQKPNFGLDNSDEPPSILVPDGICSDKCFSYIRRQVLKKGLKVDLEKMSDVMYKYNYDLSGDDSIITLDEIKGYPYYLEYMNISRRKQLQKQLS